MDNRFVIDTPEEYRQFMDGHLTGDFQFVEISQSAGGYVNDVYNIPSLTKYRHVQIHDKYNNYLQLFPSGYRSVYGRFVQGEKLLASMPRDCMKYDISLGKGVAVTTADIDAMLTWREALTIRITDSADLAYDLSQRIHAMEEKWLLEHLALTVQRHSYKQLDVAKILKKVVLMGSAYFDASPDMTAAEMKEFADNQDPDLSDRCQATDTALICKRF